MTKVLVCDDDPQVLQFVCLVLETSGYDVVSTGNGERVPDLASEGVDAVVLDVMMPVSGLEILSRLRARPETSNVPVLLLSGLATGTDRVRGLREGADDYLVKPFEPDELVLRVERLVSRASTEGREGYLGRYEVRGVLGKGSMGSVFRGWDPRLERAVALKTLDADSIRSESLRREMLGRLHHEAVTIARFNHSNIVSIYDMGNSGGAVFIAMELVDGISLADLLVVRERLPVEDLVPIAAGICAGLAGAHELSVIHRDVKPGNVLLGRDGGVKVSDFGLAYVLSSLSEAAGEVHGTPGYVPPEVLREEPYTAAGDLFGLGATLYESLAGEHPLIGQNLRETIDRTLEGRFSPLGERCPDLPPGLCFLVDRLLSASPEDRGTARETRERLEEMVAAGGYRWSADGLPEPAASPD